MNNSVICKNCSTENPLYSHTCTNCKYFIRDKISNIDIWETIGLLIELPSKAFLKIIYAEHKNFIVFLTILFSLRILILSRFVSLLFPDSDIATTPLIFSYSIALISVLILLVCISLITAVILNKKDFKVRFRDLYSLNIFSNVPNLFAVIILFPVELIVLGEYLFSNNPNPFQVKSTFAILLLAFETGMILWSVVLNFKSNFTLTANYSLSLILTAVNQLLLIGLILALSQTIFFI